MYIKFFIPDMQWVLNRCWLSVFNVLVLNNTLYWPFLYLSLHSSVHQQLWLIPRFHYSLFYKFLLDKLMKSACLLILCKCLFQSRQGFWVWRSFIQFSHKLIGSSKIATISFYFCISRQNTSYRAGYSEVLEWYSMNE